jgi:ATP-dependent DNA helicase RecQ
VLELKHDKLSTWGIGADTPATQWENIIRQLIHLGYLTQDFTRFGALSLSSAARPVLKGETTVTLGMPRNTVETVEQTRKRAGGRRDYDQALFDRLRVLRKRIADEAKLPPFVVFSDATLAEMARTMPDNRQEMRQVSGVGDRKLQQYGDAFLAEIRQYQGRDTDNIAPTDQIENDLQLSLSATKRETLRLYQQGLSLPEMATRRGLSEGTIAGHLEDLANNGAAVNLLDFVDDEKVPLIMEKLKQHGAFALSKLKQELPEEISYGDIRLVRATWTNTKAANGH